MADKYPAQTISLRSASAETVILRDQSNQTVGIVDQASANWMVHPGAVYLHEGQPYIVRSLDQESHTAQLQAGFLDYYTEPQSDTKVSVVKMMSQQTINGGDKAFGDLMITTQITGYRKVRWHTREVLGSEPLELPPSELITTGTWLWISEACVASLDAAGLWNSSPNDYGPFWPEIRRKVRSRDQYHCQSCGILETSKAHDVHHLKPFRSYHSIEEANRLENLVTLCPSCHRKAESAVRVHTGLAGAAFTLANLAPLFLMCDTGDIGVHHDLAAPFTGGRPTIAFYDYAPGGIGLSEHVYKILDKLIAEAKDLVASCPCPEGCPSCVGPGGENGYGGKSEALALLTALANDHPLNG